MIEILRLSHRISRDHRISTHCGLVARALGASKIYYSGDKDQSMEKSIFGVVENFGGSFTIEHVNEYNLIAKKKKEGYYIVHLTCYGLSIQSEIENLRKIENILVIVGGEKVEPEIYKQANINLSITNQPHSELGALSIFMHEYYQGRELDLVFTNAKTVIKPSGLGKVVIKVD